ncbi:hypothetical protein GGI02_002658 [Coemansia sp. RSA 2322]|nr:hypothetical protein GGI02_002658 [Coemansia sp. RSA 2322]
MSKDDDGQPFRPGERRHSLPENVYQPPGPGSAAVQPKERRPPPYVPTEAEEIRQSNNAASPPPQPSVSPGGLRKLLHAVGDHTFRSSRRKSVQSAKHALSGLFHRPSLESVPKGILDQGAPERRDEEHASTSDSVPRAHTEIDKRSSGSSSSKKDQCEIGIVEDEVASRSSARLASVDFLGSDSDNDVADDYLAAQHRQVSIGAARAPGLEHGPTFSAEYEAEPAPGNWGGLFKSSEIAAAERLEDSSRPNMPLEPEERVEPNMPWVVRQMGMGGQPLSSLFCDELSDGSGFDNDRYQQQERKRRRKLAFAVLKRRIGEARVGIPRQQPRPAVADFAREDGTVDYISFVCSQIKHYADTQLRHKLDYRHDSSDPCKLDRFIATLQRLVEVSAPYQHFVVWLYRLARWDSPRLSLWWCCAYFILLYYGMLLSFLWLTPVFVVVYYRLRPGHAYQWLAFERPETSIIPSKVLQDASSGTIAKGLVANRLWDIWQDTLGTHLHLILADVADWLERAKNCATWKRPWASRTVSAVLVAMALFVYFVPASVLPRLIGLCVGVQFFFLAPLQLRYQRYRHMLWVFDCFLWHCPTDVELAVETLYTQNESQSTWHRSPARHRSNNGDQPPAKRGFMAHARTLFDDMVYAYHPFPVDHSPPVTILQTASSTALDRLADDVTDMGGAYDVLSAGKRLGSKIMRESSKNSDESEQYSGLGATRGIHLPSMMERSEEQEWARRQNLARQSSRAGIPSGIGAAEAEAEGIRPQPTRLGPAQRLTQAALAEAALHDAGNSDNGRPASKSVGNSRRTSSDESSALRAHARGLTGLFRRRKGQVDAETNDTPCSALDVAPLALRHSIAVQPTDLADNMGRFSSSLSLGMVGVSCNVHSNTTQESSGQSEWTEGASLSDDPRLRSRQSIDSLLESINTSSLELTHEAAQLASLRNKDARATKDGVDLDSLYAFRCIHHGKYGTLFATSDKLVFRRSRIMGGRRSTVSSHQLSSVVAIRKSSGHFGKSHGIQMQLNSGESLSFHGLSSRDDVFGFLLVRCGNSHVY